MDNLELIKKGDKEAFVNFININQIYFYSVAINYVKNDDFAKDAISNMIYKSYQNIHKLKHIEYLKTWLTKILINECNKILKNNKKYIYLEEDIEYLDTTPNNYESLDIKNAINNLKKDEKAITLLYYYDGYKISEIAKILKIPEGTVKRKLFEIKNKLRKYLD